MKRSPLAKSAGLLLCSFFFLSLISAQNLLSNGGFEKHSQLDCLGCPMWAMKFASTLPPWRNVSGAAINICDFLYQRKGSARDDVICPFDQVKPFAGNVMMEMDYEPSCYDHNFKTRGCSSYLATRLEAPLEVGKIYELSFWLYILPYRDSSYARQIGFNLYNDAILNHDGGLLENTPFLISTVIYGRWYQVKWLVRPICNLQFLVLGVFRGPDGPPVNGAGYANRYYVDEVVLRNVPVVAADSTRFVQPYCKYSAQETANLLPEIPGMSCLFASNDSSLSATATTALDSFANRARQFPNATFIVVGHTDDVGANNQALSKARVKSVIDYLENKQQIPAFRFFQVYRGDADPAASNKTEDGRKQNRRLEIQHSSMELDILIYRNLLLATFAGDKNQAFKLLGIWLRVTKDRKKIYVLFDPRLKTLQADPRWEKLVVKKVKESYKTLPKPALAFSLDSLGKEDQKSRTLPYYIENLNAYLDAVDSVDQRFNVAYLLDTTENAAAKRDDERFQWYNKLIGNQAWPKASEVGERAAKTAFLLVSHCSDTSGVAFYLSVLKQRCMEGEAEWIHYATLYDRLQVYRCLPQRFGTQYRPSAYPEAPLERFPLENPGQTNQWRTELGLELLEDL